MSIYTLKNIDVKTANTLATQGAKGRADSSVMISDSLVFGITNYWLESGNHAALSHIMNLLEVSLSTKDLAVCRSFCSKFTGMTIKKHEETKLPVKENGLTVYIKSSDKQSKLETELGLDNLDDKESTKETIEAILVARLTSLGGDLFGSPAPKDKVGTAEERALIKLGKDLKSAFNKLNSQQLMSKAIIAGFDRNDLLNALNHVDIVGGIKAQLEAVA